MQRGQLSQGLVGVAQSENAIEELRAVRVLADLPEDQLAWLAHHASFSDYQVGDVIVAEGGPADALLAVIRGEMRGKREQKEQGASDTWLYVWKAGDVGGTLPYSRLKVWPVTGRALAPTRVASFPASILEELPSRIPVLVERLVHVMLDRARLHVRDEEQNQSLLALGRIAAGLAHELYNPAAAVQRGARELRQRFNDFRKSSITLAHHDVHDDALRVLAAFNNQEPDPAARLLDPIARSERIEQLGEWLDDHHVERAWSLAEGFLDAGIEVAELERMASHFPDAALSDALLWLNAMLAADTLLQDMETASTRVAGLVDSVKSYSYMDRSPERAETDVHVSIDDTLKILTRKLRDKQITVTREYDPDLPPVVAHAGEINQVWTNLLDNAIDAVHDGGRITVRTRSEPLHILVEIIDNGPGIPAHLRSRIWEPFFTTKDVGRGTGLGLDIVQRIVVRRHHGEIHAESVPGETCFQVRLPRTPLGP